MRFAAACLAILALAACSSSASGGTSSSPPALTGAATSVDECQPLASLPCVDQAIQVTVPLTITGLSLVYRTVQLHDGEISVESVPGRGTTFKLLLRQAADVPAARAAASAS